MDYFFLNLLSTLVLRFISFPITASGDESSKDQQTMPHVSPSEPWTIDGLDHSPAPRTL